jgi:uncharacterized CHY-type Zn-finger protein
MNNELKYSNFFKRFYTIFECFLHELARFVLSPLAQIPHFKAFLVEILTHLRINTLAADKYMRLTYPPLCSNPSNSTAQKKRLTTFPVISRPLLPYPLTVKPLTGCNIVLPKLLFDITQTQ